VPVVWVTHDLAQAGRIADDRLVLVGGRLAGEAETAAFLDSESDPDA
jgi:ABC-type phosphate transport system ATPase subunit